MGRATKEIMDADLIPVDLPSGERIGNILGDVFYCDIPFFTEFNLELNLLQSLHKQGVNSINYRSVTEVYVYTITIDDFISKGIVKGGYTNSPFIYCDLSLWHVAERG